MERLNCYMCQESIPGGLNGLSRHLSTIHGFFVNHGVGPGGFECGQDGCRRRFLHFYTLRRHIREAHLPRGNDEPEEYYENQNRIDDFNDQDIDGIVHGQENMDLEFDVVEEENVAINHGNDPDDHNNDNENLLRQFVIKMIAEFQCQGSMTGSKLTQILQKCEALMFHTSAHLKSKITKFFRERGIQNDPGVQNLLDEFELDSPFENLRTLDQQIEALTTECGYISPLEVPLGYRMDQILDRKSGTYKPKKVMETYQYVPIISVLKLVTSNPGVRHAILAEKKSDDHNVLAGYLDGDYAAIHPFFSIHKHALRIQLYYDELEIVSPLGSKTGVHKLGAFYYIIQNLPSHMNSELSSIHVLILCADADVKKYGFAQILAPFLNELAELESEEGIRMIIDEGEFVLRASLAAFCGDGLAVHDVFNLLGPSANKFCRLCLYSRDDLHVGSLEQAEPRTEETFAAHLELLERTNYDRGSLTLTGVRGSCPLNDSRYFHIAQNKVFDPMHDFLCGICPMVLKLVLREYVLVQGKFSCQYFNGRISSFQYGYLEKTNKPSANFTESMLRKRDYCLSQKAMQTWCLIRAFPFLTVEKIGRGDKHMALILQLLRIMEMVFAPKITRSLLAYLESVIADFFRMFCKLFDVHPINKMHHLTHYAECIQWLGPMAHYTCMRYEGKHNEIKLRAQVVHNFKNPSKTLIRVCQCGQSARWGGKNVNLSRLDVSSTKTVLAKHTKSRQYLRDLGYEDAEEVTSCKSVTVSGVEFRRGLYVCQEVAYQRDDNLPEFARIQEILVLRNDSVHLLTSICKCNLFDTDFHAYHIERDDPDDVHQLIMVSDLAYFKPLCCWTAPMSQNLYISLRHIML